MSHQCGNYLEIYGCCTRRMVLPHFEPGYMVLALVILFQYLPVASGAAGYVGIPKNRILFYSQQNVNSISPNIIIISVKVNTNNICLLLGLLNWRNISWINKL